MTDPFKDFWFWWCLVALIGWGVTWLLWQKTLRLVDELIKALTRE